MNGYRVQTKMFKTTLFTKKSLGYGFAYYFYTSIRSAAIKIIEL